MTLSPNLEWFERGFDAIADAPGGLAKVRETVLQLAVSGKLVPQDENDEPASELLGRIAAERARLEKAGKIRKSAPFAPISENEKPFEIPASWEWVRLDNLCFQITDGAHHTPIYTQEGVPFLSVKDITKGTIDLIKSRRISLEAHQELCKRCKPEFMDVLLTKVGTTGFAKVIDVEEEFSIFVSLALLKFPQNLLSSYFLELLINSPFVRRQSAEQTQGIGNKNLVLKAIKTFVLPLPPLAEQTRIVAKVNELLALCDEAETRQKARNEARFRALGATLTGFSQSLTPDDWTQNTARLEEHFAALLDSPEAVAPLRQSVLQLAVSGKLVPQDENDEPASELLAKIAAQKAQLIAEKKLRPSAPLPAIEEDEKPFQIPASWEWVRIKELGDIHGGMTPSMNNPRFWNGAIPWVSPKDMKPQRITESEMKVTQEAIKFTRLRIVPPRSLLMVTRSGILKRRFPVSITEIECVVNQDLKVLVPFIPEMADYLQLMLQGNQDLILARLVKGGTTVQSLKFDEFEVFPFPLPPLAEQTRIVARVTQLLALCDELEAALEERQGKAVELARAAVRTLAGNAA